MGLLRVIKKEDHNSAKIVQILNLNKQIKFVSLMGVDLGGNATDEKIPVELFLEDINDFLESAVRELYEELGILAKEEALIEIGIRKIEFEEVFEEVLFIDRQISKIFILEMNVQEKEFVLQTEEVEQVMWIEINKCIQGVRNNQFKHCIFMEELEMVKKWCDGANC